MRNLLLVVSLLVLSGTTFAQKTGEVREGKVTYVSSQNIYVEFKLTEGIFEKDTLWLVKDGKEVPAVIVNFTSSKSVAGSKAGTLKIEKDMVLRAYPSFVKKEEEKPVADTTKEKFVYNKGKVDKGAGPLIQKKNYRGRFSVQSSTDMSNMSGAPGYQRWRYAFSFNADKISGSPVSFSTYTTFSYLTSDWGREGHDLGRKLKVYDFKMQYELDTLSFFNAGRFIYRKIANIGAIDGILYERSFNKKWSAGAFAGSRPNIEDYGYNFKLFQLGAYGAHTDSLGTGIMENSFGIVNQTNDFKTDRRFIYLQHVSNPSNSVSLFASSEIDFYTVEAGEGKTKPSLTNFFASVRYAFSREYNFVLAYDRRKNVIYYESYRTFIDSVLINETMQGLRAVFNTTAIKNVSLSLRAGVRNMGNDKRVSQDFGASAYFTSLPYVAGYLGANVSYLKSNYVDGFNYGITYSRDLLEDLFGTFGFRRIDYNFPAGGSTLAQNILSFDLNWTISKQFDLSLNYEGVFEESSTFSRIFVDFTTRF